MPVKFFEFSSIEVRKFNQQVEKNVQITTNQEISHVLERQNSETEINFKFTINYMGSSQIALMRFEGFVIYAGESGIANYYAKNRELPVEVADEVILVILNHCVTQAMNRAMDMGLSPPINLKQMIRPPTPPITPVNVDEGRNE